MNQYCAVPIYSPTALANPSRTRSAAQDSQKDPILLIKLIFNITFAKLLQDFPAEFKSFRIVDIVEVHMVAT